MVENMYLLLYLNQVYDTQFLLRAEHVRHQLFCTGPAFIRLIPLPLLRVLVGPDWLRIFGY